MLVRGTGWSGERVLGKYPHPYQPQVAGAGEEYSPPPHPHRLQNTTGSKMISDDLNGFLVLQKAVIITRHTLHVKLVSHVVVLGEQRGAGGGGDAATDPLHTHLFFQTLDPARAL